MPDLLPKKSSDQSSNSTELVKSKDDLWSSVDAKQLQQFARAALKMNLANGSNPDKSHVEVVVTDPRPARKRGTISGFLLKWVVVVITSIILGFAVLALMSYVCDWTDKDTVKLQKENLEETVEKLINRKLEASQKKSDIRGELHEALQQLKLSDDRPNEQLVDIKSKVDRSVGSLVQAMKPLIESMHRRLSQQSQIAPRFQDPQPHTPADQTPQFQSTPQRFQGPDPRFQGPDPRFQGPHPRFQSLPPRFPAPAPEFPAPAPEFPAPAPLRRFSPSQQPTHSSEHQQHPYMTAVHPIIRIIRGSKSMPDGAHRRRFSVSSIAPVEEKLTASRSRGHDAADEGLQLPFGALLGTVNHLMDQPDIIPISTSGSLEDIPVVMGNLMTSPSVQQMVNSMMEQLPHMMAMAQPMINELESKGFGKSMKAIKKAMMDPTEENLVEVVQTGENELAAGEQELEHELEEHPLVASLLQRVLKDSTQMDISALQTDVEAAGENVLNRMMVLVPSLAEDKQVKSLIRRLKRIGCSMIPKMRKTMQMISQDAPNSKIRMTLTGPELTDVEKLSPKTWKNIHNLIGRFNSFKPIVMEAFQTVDKQITKLDPSFKEDLMQKVNKIADDMEKVQADVLEEDAPEPVVLPVEDKVSLPFAGILNLKQFTDDKGSLRMKGNLGDMLNGAMSNPMVQQALTALPTVLSSFMPLLTRRRQITESDFASLDQMLEKAKASTLGKQVEMMSEDLLQDPMVKSVLDNMNSAKTVKDLETLEADMVQVGSDVETDLQKILSRLLADPKTQEMVQKVSAEGSELLEDLQQAAQKVMSEASKVEVLVDNNGVQLENLSEDSRRAVDRVVGDVKQAVDAVVEATGIVAKNVEANNPEVVQKIVQEVNLLAEDVSKVENDVLNEDVFEETVEKKSAEEKLTDDVVTLEKDLMLNGKKVETNLVHLIEKAANSDSEKQLKNIGDDLMNKLAERADKVMKDVGKMLKREKKIDEKVIKKVNDEFNDAKKLVDISGSDVINVITKYINDPSLVSEVDEATLKIINDIKSVAGDVMRGLSGNGDNDNGDSLDVENVIKAILKKPELSRIFENAPQDLGDKLSPLIKDLSSAPIENIPEIVIGAIPKFLGPEAAAVIKRDAEMLVTDMEDAKQDAENILPQILDKVLSSDKAADIFVKLQKFATDVQGNEGKVIESIGELLSGENVDEALKNVQPIIAQAQEIAGELMEGMTEVAEDPVLQQHVAKHTQTLLADANKLQKDVEKSHMSEDRDQLIMLEPVQKTEAKSDGLVDANEQLKVID